jgi:predicted outer membrane repeat protein
MLIARSDVEIDDALFAGNLAWINGGALRSLAGSTMLRNVLFVGNEASSQGGALYSRAGETRLLGGALVGNVAGISGGGLALYNEVLLLRQVVLAGNQAAEEGGGLYLPDGGDADLVSVVLSGNSAGVEGGGVWRGAGPSYGLPALVVEHGDSWANTPDDWTGFTDPIGSDGNLSVDPQLLDVSAPDPLDWDLHLALGSPLIDAGPSAWTDPDGSPSDMGAFGGFPADSWDVDADGAPAWWMPGPYLTSYPALGWDCDDLDPALGPAGGC